MTIEKARSYLDRSFHNLATLHRLEPTKENLIHEETTHRRVVFQFFFSRLILHAFSGIGLVTMKENKGKNVASGIEEEEVQVL